MTDLGKSVGYVLESTPSLIRIEIENAKIFEEYKSQLSVGQYVLISSGNNKFLLASITGLRASHAEVGGAVNLRFVVDAQPAGSWSPGIPFERGAQALPVPTEGAFVAPSDILQLIFANGAEASFSFASLSVAANVPLEIDGDRFFSKHVAVVGSTGSGKSCAVSSILQKVVGFSEGKNIHKALQKNSHIVIFDIHSEYSAAFNLKESESFTLNNLNVDNLMLPYWLLNAQELEEMFVESNEINSHNQISQFRHAVVRNKRRHNAEISNVSFDSPIYFSIDEVVTYLENMNTEVIGKLTGEGKPKLASGDLVEDRNESYFDKLNEFATSSTAKDTRASNGPFNGEFDRLILRLKTRLSDPRLEFLFYPKNSDGRILKTDDFSVVIRQFIGYITKSNISIVDLSGMPFEVLSIVVSLISRMIFDFGFHYTKQKHSSGGVSDIPIMLICEEAHNYVPRSGGAEYNASLKSIERIAKEGRKYGVTLMIVSQRPSEVSETIFSQCSNFISLRLTNVADQNYIKSLLPDLAIGVGDLLPNLQQGEFLIVGDAVLMPSIGRFGLPVPEPHSRSVKYLSEWQADWRPVDFDKVIDRWRGRAQILPPEGTAS